MSDFRARGKRWAELTLGDLAWNVRERVLPGDHPHLPYIGMDNVEPQTMKLLGTVPSSTMKSASVHFKPGDVLYGRLRPYLNKVITADFDGLASAEFIPLTIASGIVPRLIQYRLNAADFVSYAAHLDDGDRPRVDYDQIGAFRFRVPPLPEQHRIVEAIESYFTRLDDAVATLERVQRNLKRYRASVLKAAVEGRLVPTEAELARAEGRDYEPASALLDRILSERRRRWQEAGGRGKYQEPVAPDTSSLPALPEGWCWASLPRLGELNRGKSKHRPRNDPRLLDGPYPFIQTGDVRKADGFIRSHEATYSEFGLAQSRLWPAGTLCITIAANIADPGILGFDACFPDSVVGFLQDDPLIARYVELFIRTAREKLDQYAPGTAQKNINLQVLAEVAVPLPPEAEQRRIVMEVDSQFSVATYCGNVAMAGESRCQRLRQSILKWAFEGKLADQDPNDEPASILLECIKAERAAAVAATTNGRVARKRQRTA